MGTATSAALFRKVIRLGSHIFGSCPTNFTKSLLTLLLCRPELPSLAKGSRSDILFSLASCNARSEIACTCCGVSRPHAYISRSQTLNVESLLAAAMPAPEALLFLAGGPKSAMAQEVGHAESFHCYFAISKAPSTFGFWVQGFRVKSL